MYEQPDERLNYVAKSYSSSAILKHLKAGTECACSAVFETCRRVGGERENMQLLTSLSSVLYTCCQFKYFLLDLSGKYLT